MNKISILLVGTEKWEESFEIPPYVEICNQDELCFEKIVYDVVVLTRSILPEEVSELKKMARCYCVFASDVFSPDRCTTRFMEEMCAQILPQRDVQRFLNEDAVFYFPDSYGEKNRLENIGINHGFAGRVSYHGLTGVELEGDFGNNWNQVLYFKVNYPIDEGQMLEYWLEYSHSESVEIMLVTRMITTGSADDVTQTWNFSEKDLKNIIRIKNDGAKSSLFFSISVRGHGILKINGMHGRYSRNGMGNFLIGAERYVTSKREEIFCYFEPGDKKPPLNIFFSGYKTREGFEGYYMMKNMHTPFLLVTEQRLEGGAFYLGDEEYEELMKSVLKKYIDKLKFSPDEVVMSGVSMGSTGAMYYGADINPYALILGKPLANLGYIAEHERINRPGGFPTSLDLLLSNTGSMDEASIEKLNEHFWRKFENADWSNTKMIVAYLYEDDYDNEAYQGMLKRLDNSRIKITSKGIHGRHNDNHSMLISWFKSQYKRMLMEDFFREM